MLTIGTSTNNPLVIIDCGIHAREWITPAVCQCYVDHVRIILIYLIQSYKKAFF